MSRIVAIGLLVVVAATSTACTSSSDKVSTLARPTCGAVAGATYSSTTTAPCTSTTTTTTLPTPLALGATVTLSESSGRDLSSSTIRISRILTGASPVAGFPDVDISDELASLHAPTHVKWIAVDLTMTNVGERPIELASPTGMSAPYLSVIVNGLGPDLGDSAFPQVGFVVGASGCPYAFAGERSGFNPGMSVSGCIAIPVPADFKVESVGFALGFPGFARLHVAQWHI